MDQYYTYPRLYADVPLRQGDVFTIETAHAHYLKNVLRCAAGDHFRVFNGKDGEFLAEIKELGKKSGQAFLKEKIRPQPQNPREIHLIFAPIKKHRMDVLVEKAVELGVTQFHPVITQRTEIGKINESRMQTQVTEAAEQCERMSVPVIHPLVKLPGKISAWTGTPVSWCFERSGEEPAHSFSGEEIAFLIGPVGGFTDEEAAFLSAHPSVRMVSLGETVYRVETAALVCLARVK